jgi:prepilin-type N-terminal cleavage/methylation domain-containing protein
MRRQRTNHLRGFTLIELLVVITLATIMSTIVAVSLASSHRAARAQDVAERIVTFDRLGREHARRFGKPNDLVFDLGLNTVTRAHGERGDADSTDATLNLPSGVRVVRIVTPTADTAVGRVAVPCSTRGRRPTYALLLTQNGGGTARWQLIVGLTGQSFEPRDESEVQDIFRAIRGDAGR